MSLNYASSLSPYANKGKLGQPEKHDPIEIVRSKCQTLAQMINESKYMVAITGAGISTSAGIPDFRGPNGVWTLEKKGLQPDQNVSFDRAFPTFTHHALVYLNTINKLKFLISQNIDGLHMRSSFPMNRLAELHGNMFVEKCHSCLGKHISTNSSVTIGLKSIGKKCPRIKSRGQSCRGQLHDTILDWEDALPADDMQKSELNCKRADLCLCLGTTLQIMPVGNYPLLTKNNNGKVVVVNLQETRIDSHADLVINEKLDVVFRTLFEDYFNVFIKWKQLPPRIRLKSLNDSENDREEKKCLLDVSGITIDGYEEREVDMMRPNVLLLLSGKRKCGKDYTCEKLTEKLKALGSEHKPVEVHYITLAAPVKELYAQERGGDIDYTKLLGSSEYKELYRKELISLCNAKRIETPELFCQLALDKVKRELQNDSGNKFQVWIVTDCRRTTDFLFFLENFSQCIKTMRVVADAETRKQRHWTYTVGVDDGVTECDLDWYSRWDFIIRNNNDTELEESLQCVLDHVRSKLA